MLMLVSHHLCQPAVLCRAQKNIIIIVFSIFLFCVPNCCYVLAATLSAANWIRMVWCTSGEWMRLRVMFCCRVLGRRRPAFAFSLAHSESISCANRHTRTYSNTRTHNMETWIFFRILRRVITGWMVDDRLSWIRCVDGGHFLQLIFWACGIDICFQFFIKMSGRWRSRWWPLS